MLTLKTLRATALKGKPFPADGFHRARKTILPEENTNFSDEAKKR